MEFEDVDLFFEIGFEFEDVKKSLLTHHKEVNSMDFAFLAKG